MTAEARSPSAESELLRTWHRELLEAGAAWEHATARELRRAIDACAASPPDLEQRVRGQLSDLRSRKDRR